MRLLSAIIALSTLLLGTAVSIAATRLSITFDESPIGAPPEGFFFAAARQAMPGAWDVQGAGPHRHLVHAADPTVTMRGISVAGLHAPMPADVKVTTRLRLVDGDRAGGVVWHYRDANNFYFMALALSDRNPGPLGERYANLVRVTGGNRILLDSSRMIDLDPGAWHTLAVIQEGDQIRGTINGIGLLKARDNTLAEGGRAGVWSAGNSTTWFDQIAIDDYPE